MSTGPDHGPRGYGQHAGQGTGGPGRAVVDPSAGGLGRRRARRGVGRRRRGRARLRPCGGAQSYDRLLIGAANEIAGAVRRRVGEILVDIPASAFELLSLPGRPGALRRVGAGRRGSSPAWQSSDARGRAGLRRDRLRRRADPARLSPPLLGARLHRHRRGRGRPDHPRPRRPRRRDRPQRAPRRRADRPAMAALAALAIRSALQPLADRERPRRPRAARPDAARRRRAARDRGAVGRDQPLHGAAGPAGGSCAT